MSPVDKREYEGSHKTEAPGSVSERAFETGEEAHLVRSAVLAKMSHELRTPLNAIIGYAELLLEEAEERELREFVPDLTRIRSAGQNMLALITDLLDLSLIDAGRMDIYLEPFELEPVLDEVLAGARQTANRHGNQLLVRFRGTPGVMYADQHKVRYVLTTLLNNAVTSTHHGNIRFSVERSSRYPNEGEWYIFKVTDSGIGLTSEQIEHLFTPFAASEPTPGRQLEQSSLGLVISRLYCQMMGGEIRAESELGQGTTLSVWLPRKVRQIPDLRLGTGSASHEGSPEDRVFEVSSPRTETVLVIDGDSATRDLIVRYLSKKGLRAVEASSGEEGLRLATRLQPDVIILNMLMPDGSGWTTLSALKSAPRLNEIPVIFMSYAEDRNAGFALGASEFLPKPVDFGRLAALVEKYRSGYEARPEPAGQILIVDGDPEVRSGVRSVLETARWRVFEAENGLDALRLLEEYQPDLVMLDLLLPVMNGFELIDEVNRHPGWRNIPMIVLTSVDLTPSEQTSLDSSVERILNKHHYEPLQLLRTVHDLILLNTRQPWHL